MIINISDLRKITNLLLTRLEEEGHTSVEISQDYYWDIAKEKRFNPYEEPKELTLGQLTDDWNEINNILKKQNPPISYALVWVAAILRVIGEETIV